MARAKSTLIRMLTTLVPPTSGTAVVAGHDIIRDPNAGALEHWGDTAEHDQRPELTCAEILALHARL